MPTIADLMSRAEQLAARDQLSLSTVSRKILNDGKGLSRLKAGGQVTVKTLATAFEKLRELERGKAIERKDTIPGIERKFFAPADFGGLPPRPAGGRKDGAALGPLVLSHLDRLEAEAIHIMREVAAEAENPVMLYSIGKDSSVMLHLAAKAFFPSRPPFPLMHVDTTWKFKDMYKHRDWIAKELGFSLLVHINEDGVKQGIGPFTHGSAIHTDVMKTQGLKQALDKYRFDVAFGGARRDEEKSRAKERIFSFRSAQHRWDPKNQRPELWSIYNTRIHKGESIRVFPISNWTELDIWQYIYRETIEIPSLYFAKERAVVERDGALIMVDDERMPLAAGEQPKMEMVRFRTLGCYPLTGAVRSNAATLPEVIQEMLVSTSSERQGRVIDHDQSASMEKKKQEGYF
jgi:sulfate adenylyltransferase subunit 2